MVDSSVAVGGGPTGSSSSSVAEWKLSSSLGGAGESSVVESCVRSEMNVYSDSTFLSVLLCHIPSLVAFEDHIWQI